MIRNQGPGVALCLGFFEDDGEPFQERFAVLVVEEELSTFYSPGHDVLEKAWGVKSWLAGHFSLAVMLCYCNYFHLVFRQADKDGSVLLVQTE